MIARALWLALFAGGLVGCGGDGGGGGKASGGGGAGGSGGATGGTSSGGTGGSGTGGMTAGTGGTGGLAGAGAAGGGAGGSGGIDYGAGTWSTENLSKSPGTITHDGRLVFNGSEQILAWSEPDSIDTNDQDIWAGALGSVKAVTSDSKVQNAYPSLALADGNALLAFNGYPAVDNDIYLATGPTFASPVNLTEASDTPNLREDYAPALAVGTGGTRAVVYLSAPQDFEGERELRFVEWTGTPSALAPTTIVSGKGDCDHPSIAIDPQQKLHVVVACGPFFKERAYYVSNVTGSWNAIEIGIDEGDASTQIAITPDGKKLYAAWLDANGNIALASSSVGGSWSSPQTAVTNGYSPVLAADAQGRALIAFHRDNAQKTSDVYVTWSEGSGFHAPVLLTPTTETSNEWMPSQIALEPDTGIPHILFVGIEAGSDPLNSDVWRAKLAP